MGANASREREGDHARGGALVRAATSAEGDARREVPALTLEGGDLEDGDLEDVDLEKDDDDGRDADADAESGRRDAHAQRNTPRGDPRAMMAMQTCIMSPQDVDTALADDDDKDGDYAADPQSGDEDAPEGRAEKARQDALVVESGELPLRSTSMLSGPREGREGDSGQEDEEEEVSKMPRSASEAHLDPTGGRQQSQQLRSRRGHHQPTARGVTLAEWRRMRVERLRRRHKHSYKQRKYAPDQIESGKRKKRSALHGTGASKWYEAKNWYYALLDWSWAFVFFLSALSYLLACLFWSLISWTRADDIECESGEEVFIPGTFGSAFVFATSNILTLGYGPCLPGSYGLYSLSCVQQFSGIMLNVIVLSVVVSKFQIPKPDIVFSKKALVTTRDATPTLLIRVGNRRVNLVYETRVSVALLRFHETTEGEHFVSYEPLATSFPPVITAVATIIHAIDAKSPLRRYLLDPEEMANIVLSVSFSGHDSIYNDMLVCTTQYKGTDLELGGVLFGNMMERRRGGKGIRANFDKFDGVEAAVGVTHDELMEALGAHEFDTDDESGSDDGALAPRRSRFLASELRDSNGSAGRAPRHVRSRDVVLRNDVSHAAVLTELPEDPSSKTVYICYGCIRIRNYLVRMCPYSRMVTMFLVEAGIPHQVIDVDWNNKPAWFTAAVATGRTPAVFFKGKWTRNSRDIMRFLHHKFRALADRVNRPHDLPVSTWSFFDVLERHAHLLLFSSPEKMHEMLLLNPEEARGKVVLKLKAGGAGKMDEAMGWDRAGLGKLRRQRKVKDRPPADGPGVFLCIGVGHRGERLARNCPTSQRAEMLLRALKIPHRTVLVDEDDPPAWVASGQLPMLLGPGPAERVTIGDGAILRLVRELYPAELARLPRRLPFDEAFGICEALKSAADAYMMRPDGSGSAAQSDETDAALLEALLDVLRPLENALAEVQSAGGSESVDGDAACADAALTWYTFLSGAKELGVDDLILAPHLHFFAERVLRPMGGLCLEHHGLCRLQRYIYAMGNTALMRETSEAEGAEPFYVLHAAASFEKRFPEWQPVRCRRTPERERAEADMVSRLVSSYGDDMVHVGADGSISTEGGLAGPPLEMNTVYLAIGCVHREEYLVKVCPFSRVVEMVASEAGIPHQTVKIDLLDKPAWFRSATLSAQSPSIYWNGAWVSESQVVLDTLRKLFPRRYGALDRPLSLEGVPGVAGKAEMGLFNASDAICEDFLKAKTNDPAREEKRRALDGLLGALESQLEASGGPFLLGPLCAVADIALICSIWRIVKVCCAWFFDFDLQREGYPRVDAWVSQLKRRESFASSMPGFAEPFLILFTAKFYGDPQDPEHSPLQVTALVKQNERDAVAKLRLQEFGNLAQRTGHDMLHLAQLESVLRVLEDVLGENEAHGAGSYLCGQDLGLADLLVVSHLVFIESGVQCVHEISLLERGFPHVRALVDRVTSKPRFREFLSPAYKQLLRIHFADRLSDRFPFLKLQREEREHLELAAVGLVTASKRGQRDPERRPPAGGWNEKSTGSLTTGSQSSGGASSTGDIEDLLFCI